MSNTRYARDRVLRLDGAEAGVLARAVMAAITQATTLRTRMQPGSYSDQQLDAEVRTLRSLLERLSD